MEEHAHRLELVCRLGGKQIVAMAKSHRHLVVSFVGEVLACFGENISDDVEGVHPKHVS